MEDDREDGNTLQNVILACALIFLVIRVVGFRYCHPDAPVIGAWTMPLVGGKCSYSTAYAIRAVPIVLFGLGVLVYRRFT